MMRLFLCVVAIGVVIGLLLLFAGIPLHRQVVVGQRVVAHGVAPRLRARPS